VNNALENPKPEAPGVALDGAMAQTIRLLARLGRERFYGKVTLSFEAGNIATIRKEETLKANELGR